ncbi:MAG: gamma-glutamylcyclotransferase, partial [Thermoleophilia bacterium]|nr:gamma-glutamylcyclotransferase [Thermoleophilia bacterium]
MSGLFVYGTLCDPRLQRAVIGREPPCRPARIHGFGIRLAAGRDRPMLVRPGEGAEGLLLTGLSDREVARAAYYEEAFGFVPLAVEIDAGGERREALAFAAPPGTEAGGTWSLARWAPSWGDTAAGA